MFARWFSPCRRPIRRPHPALRPFIEWLEDRTVPAVVVWDGEGGSDTSWHNSLNWSGDQLPGAGDDAVIGSGYAGITVTVGGDVTVRRVECNAGVRITGGTFTVTGPDSVSVINNDFENDGDVVIGSDVYFSLNGGGTHAGSFDVAAGSILVFHADHELGASSKVSGAGEVWFGAGEPPFGHTTIGGTYDVAGGTRVLNAAADFTGTVLDVGDTLAIGVSNGFGTGSSAKFGNFELDLETLFLQGTLTSDAPITVNQTFHWALHGTLGGSGAVIIQPAATLTMDNWYASPGYKYMSGRTLVNYGVATLSGAVPNAPTDSDSLVLQNGARVENHGLLELRDGRSLGDGGGGPNRVTNHASGTVRVVSGLNAAITTPFDNAGAFKVETGAFVYVTGGGTHAGCFKVATGSGIAFGGAHQFDGPIRSEGYVAFGIHFLANDMTVAGGYTAGSDAVTLAVAGPGPGWVRFASKVDGVGRELTIQGATTDFGNNEITVPDLVLLGGTLTSTADLTVIGTFTWYDGTLTGTGPASVAPGATLRITSLATLDGRSLDLHGTGEWPGSTITFRNGAVFTNHGTFDIPDNRNLVNGGGAASKFVNAGLLQYPGGAFGSVISVPATNSGTIETTGGYLAFSAGLTQTAGTLHLDGGIVQTTLNLQGGSITGNGSLWGPVVNGGAISPGDSTGTIEVRNGYSQTAAGELTVEIGGLSPVSEFDQLTAVGTVALGGALKVNFIDGFALARGLTVRIIDNDGTDKVIGNFAGLEPDNTFVQDNRRYRVSTTGGTGNDVSVTRINQRPVIINGGPYAYAEGVESLTLDAKGTHDDDPEGDTLSYTWDLNGDGKFGDATGDNPTLSKNELIALGMYDGNRTFNARVRVNDGQELTDSPFTITVVNTPPDFTDVLGPNGTSDPVAAVRGQPLSFTLVANDISPADQQQPFEFHMDWTGDNITDEVITVPSNTTITHVFPDAGKFTVHVTSKDDHDFGPTDTIEAMINVAMLQLEGGKQSLFVGGTTGDDQSIHIAPGSGQSAGNIVVKIAGTEVYNGTFPTGRIVVYGQAGNDTITVTNGITIPAWLYGDHGDDTLTGGSKNDYLVGGWGDDTLSGNAGDDTLYGDSPNSAEFVSGMDTLNGGADNDLLVGGGWDDTLDGDGGDDVLYGDDIDNNPNIGQSADTLRGGAGNDLLLGGGSGDQLWGEAGNDVLVGGFGGDPLLDGGSGNDLIIAGRTVYDGDQAALLAVRDEWKVATTATAADRRTALMTGVGPGGIVRLNATTVFTDSNNVAYGGGNKHEADWFIVNMSMDGVRDQDDNDLINFS